jgi:hypothetical protein
MSEIESKTVTEIENANDDYTSSLSVIKFLNLIVDCQKSLRETEREISKRTGIENSSVGTVINNRGRMVRDENSERRRKWGKVEDPKKVYVRIQASPIFDALSKFTIDYWYGIRFKNESWNAWHSISIGVTDMTPLGDSWSIGLEHYECSENNLLDIEEVIRRWLKGDLRHAQTFNLTNPFTETFFSDIYSRVHELIVSMKWNEIDEGDYFRNAIYEKSPEEFKKFDETLNSIRHEIRVLAKQHEAKES